MNTQRFACAVVSQLAAPVTSAGDAGTGEATTDEIRAARGTPRRPRDRESPQPAGGKRALLHARRQRQRAIRIAESGSTDSEQPLCLRTGDGALVFVLRLAASGLLVERMQRRPIGTCFAQTLLFTDHAGFARWCDADTVRFDEPVLYHRLRREGHARLGD
jgi:hypothetical protein